MREELFSKFKDYNKELEKILEKKDFSKDTKNLLLSMFYKLEMSYQDYVTVKRKVPTKQEYLENILENIKNCHSIELVKPSQAEFEELKENNLYIIDFKLGKIKVIANELAILSALLELNNFQIHLSETYNLIHGAMPYLLNTAYDVEKIEVLRDFNAWSWNTLTSEIKDVRIHLVYQTLKIALDLDLFQLMQQDQMKTMDVMDCIYQKLLTKYPSKLVERLIEQISKIAIMLYIQVSENEKKRLQEEKEMITQELEEIKNKKAYIEKQSQKKKQLVKEVKTIDVTVNNRKLLYAEFEKRNKKLSAYQQIFSLSHLVEKLQKERKRLIEKIEECSKNIEPSIYLQHKGKLQKEYNLLKNISFEKENQITKAILELQKMFLKELLPDKLKNAETKEELLDFVYELRYYWLLPFNYDMEIKDHKALQELMNPNLEELIKKSYKQKLLNTLSTNEDNDIEIIKQIFYLRMIDLENIYIQIKKKSDTYFIQIYDEQDTLEKEITMNLSFHPKDKVKCNRKIKLFI